MCFQCGKDFTDKSEMMRHIKSDHKTSICRKFLANECDREDGTEDECWFRHVTNAAKLPVHKTKSYHNQNLKISQDFHKIPVNLVPPTPVLNQESLEKSIEEKVLRSVSQMMSSFMEQMKKNV